MMVHCSTGHLQIPNFSAIRYCVTFGGSSLPLCQLLDISLNNGCTSSMQLHSLCGKAIISISAGKYWTAAVTVTGDTYMWDGKKGKDAPPMPTRLHGVKKATSVSVGETHLLIVSSLYHPCYLPQIADGSKKQKVQGELDELCEGFMFDDVEHEDILSHMQKDDSENPALPSSRISCEKQSVPSLKSLCEKVAAEHLVEPRNAIQLLEIADSLGADDLKRHCEVWFTDSHVVTWISFSAFPNLVQ